MTNASELHDNRMRNHPLANLKEGDARRIPFDEHGRLGDYTLQSFRSSLSQMGSWLGHAHRTSVDRNSTPECPYGCLHVMRINPAFLRLDGRSRHREKRELVILDGDGSMHEVGPTVTSEGSSEPSVPDNQDTMEVDACGDTLCEEEPEQPNHG